MHRPIHFEIPVNEPEKAMEFYGKIFGWKFQQFGSEPYWLVSTGAPDVPGIDGGIMKRRHPEQPLVNTMGVADVDASLEAIVAAGGSVAVPKMAIPGVGWLAYGKDPEGNIFGIMKMDPAAV